MNIWNILGIIAASALIFSFALRANAVWGALILGIVIGVIVCLISGFSWLLLRKVITISVVVGLFFEVGIRVANRWKRRKITNQVRAMIDAQFKKEYPQSIRI